MKKNSFYVYAIFRLDGRVCYIGKGSGERCKVHLKRAANQHLARIVAKAAKELPIVKIRENLTEIEAFDIERTLIAAIGREKENGPLVNMTDGGEGFSGGRHAPDFKVRIGPKISAAKMGHSVSDETREKIRVARTGKSLSATHVEKIKASLAGVAKTPEHAASTSAAVRKAYAEDPEYREKIRAANLGKKRPEWARQRMSEAQKRRYANTPKPWVDSGISRSKWYRLQKKKAS